MPDAGAPVSIIQNSFSTGEISPKLYGRTDLAKYAAGCAYLDNFYVDYKGGVTTRPGSQFIGVPGSAGRTRLWPYVLSPELGSTYMTVWSDEAVCFIKNPGGPCYPNSSNAAFIESSPGVQYEVVTPYQEADLYFMKFAQIIEDGVPVLYVTCPGYVRRKLEYVSDTSWTLTAVSSTPGISQPTISAIEISALPAASTDPEDTYYMYAVSAVSEDGEESFPSAPFISGNGINIGVTQGTVTVFWAPVAGAKYYKVWKALPTTGDKIPHPSEQLGFAGFAYGTIFTDSNIVADFARQPIADADPFAIGPLIGYSITASSSNWPVGSTTITVGGAGGGVVYAVLDNNDAGGTGSIVGLYIARRGTYAVAPTLTAGGGGTTFTATAIIGPTTGTEPQVVGTVQQRMAFASTDNRPNGIFLSRPGFPDDNRISNPVNDGDAMDFNLFARSAIDVKWLQDMPGGLVIGTNDSIVQLTGGSASANNPVAISPTNSVVVPQSNYGATDLFPQVIDYDIIFVTPDGLVIDLQYNFFVNIYTGTDTTVLASHLFETTRIIDWAYQDTPRKIIWAVQDNGAMLSLTWLKAQEISGWAHHETQGIYEAVAAVREGSEIAVYMSVFRSNANRCIERMAGSQWFQQADAWQLDSALSIDPTFPVATMAIAAATGTNVIMQADAAVFGAGDVGKVVYARGGRATITAFNSSTQVRVTITQVFRTVVFPATLWSMNANVSSLSGLAHLNGQTVYALVDGAVQGPFTVSGGAVTLTTPGSRVVVGLLFNCRLQPLYLDVNGETTLQGRRKKVAAASVRVFSASRLKYGTSFATTKEWVPGVASTDPELDFPYPATSLYTGDQRMAIDQYFNVGGWVCVEQAFPLPATILAIIPEFAQGDTR